MRGASLKTNLRYLSIACQVKCFSKNNTDVNQKFCIKAICSPGVPPREGWAPVRLNRPFLEVDNRREC